MKTEIFEDLVNFLVEKLPAEEVISFCPSPRAQERFNELSNSTDLLHKSSVEVGNSGEEVES